LPNKTTVCFNVDKEIFSGQSLCIVGSIPELGSWSTFDAVMTEKYPNSWTFSMEIENGLSFEYKYVISDQFNQRQWENGENHEVNLFNISDKTH
jgi:4-alpha-glucanotransferase